MVVALCFQIPMVSDYVLRVGWSRLGFCNSGRILPVVKLWFGRSSLAVVGSVWAALTMAGGEASISSSKLRGLGFDGFEGFNLG
ncbi:unnamed protein product [Thlaspi arvense]|uniref:Uncharacterized protein n=1 Tax=Thlaspi arvense TaxID=13288 RepID=A0AAU9SL18_THLAR|nr:unnamed protein product [Thlaspi arvense]